MRGFPGKLFQAEEVSYQKMGNWIMGKPLNAVTKELINKAHQAKKDTVLPIKREHSIFCVCLRLYSMDHRK